MKTVKTPALFGLLIGGACLLGLFLNTIFSMQELGIQPRHLEGMWHIFTSPFIHGSWAHLSGNLLAFYLGFALLVLADNNWKTTLSLLFVGSGFATWLLGGAANHIGLSGVIYAMLSYLFFTGIFERSLKHVLVSVVVAAVFSGLLRGLIPQEGVSFAAHFGGVIFGAGLSFLNKTSKVTWKKPTINPPKI